VEEMGVQGTGVEMAPPIGAHLLTSTFVFTNPEAFPTPWFRLLREPYYLCIFD
jgi:hypothetical protein